MRVSDLRPGQRLYDLGEFPGEKKFLGPIPRSVALYWLALAAPDQLLSRSPGLQNHRDVPAIDAFNGARYCIFLNEGFVLATNPAQQQAIGFFNHVISGGTEDDPNFALYELKS